MNAFRYEAVETNGSAVEGVIEAEDRKSALQLLGQEYDCLRIDSQAPFH